MQEDQKTLPFFSGTGAKYMWLYGKRYRKDFIIQNNAIDAKAYKYNPKIEEQVRKEFNLEGKFVIGHVGRFFLQKNHNFLIDIFN